MKEETRKERIRKIKEILTKNKIKDEQDFINKWEAEYGEQITQGTVSNWFAYPEIKAKKTKNMPKGENYYYIPKKVGLLDRVLKEYCHGYVCFEKDCYSIALTTEYVDEEVVASLVDEEIGADIISLLLGIRSVYVIFKTKVAYTQFLDRLKSCKIKELKIERPEISNEI